MNSMVWTIIYFVAIIAIIYFLLIRPQKKRTKQHNDMVNNLTIGVEVVSIGGIHGEVSRIKDDTIWMKVSNNVEIELEKSAIGRIVS
ncbi:MAG TPA: preprotein translocase subunit YajC [Firmicutes bacterium]|nr:preprotein translocase subunit YajC [Bacillota bacterium]